jgi:putative transposase
VDQSLFAVIMEAYLLGTSTRKVDDLVRALSCQHRHQQERRAADLRRVDGEVAAFCDRSLKSRGSPMCS